MLRLHSLGRAGQPQEIARSFPVFVSRKLHYGDELARGWRLYGSVNSLRVTELIAVARCDTSSRFPLSGQKSRILIEGMIGTLPDACRLRAHGKRELPLVEFEGQAAHSRERGRAFS